MPVFLFSMAFGMVRSSIQTEHNFDIYDVNPIQNVDKCFSPALFLLPEQDDFVQPHHTHELFEKYQG
jgi:hypothetical protein